MLLEPESRRLKDTATLRLQMGESRPLTFAVGHSSHCYLSPNRRYGGRKCRPAPTAWVLDSPPGMHQDVGQVALEMSRGPLPMKADLNRPGRQLSCAAT